MQYVYEAKMEILIYKSCDMNKDRKWERKRQKRILLSGIYFTSGQRILH